MDFLKNRIGHTAIFLFTFGATIFATTAVQSATKLEQEIIDRIKPVGEVCLEGEDCAVATAAPASAGPAEARSGEKIYNTSCFACHGTGVAGAPKVGDPGVWASRMENGLDAMVSNAINGINAMPPRGTCMDCSDEEIQTTVQYMLDNSQ